MDGQLPALVVVVPLAGALVAAMVRHGAAAWLIALAAVWTTFAVAIRLVLIVYDQGTISYVMGGWPVEIGIEYRVDRLGAAFLLLVLAVGAAIIAMARRSVAAEIDRERVAWFYAMLLLCLTGLVGIAITGDAFNAFVFLEISSLSSYALIAFGRDRRALLSAYQYLIMGTIGATFYVIGVGLLYIDTGTLNLALIADRLAEVESGRTALAALAFIVVGISLKLALFPLHFWLPGAYAYAPSIATAFLAATATKVAVYLLVRYVYSVFGAGFVFADLPVTPILIALSLAAMFAASAVAIFQANLKRLLAYSSLGQIGYVTLGLALADVTGLTGGLVQALNHALAKGAAFAAVAAIMLRTGTVRLEELAGIGRRMPVTMGAFVVAGAGLIGIPGTTGFVSKWYLVLASVEAGRWWLGFLVAGSSLLAIVYVGRVVEIAFFRPPAGRVAGAREAPAEMLVPILTLAGAVVYFGLDTNITVGLAEGAARFLLAGPR